jgi:hypothetical protein
MPGLTAAGLVIESYKVARERVASNWRSKMGQNSPTETGSENGLIIDVIALSVALLWESVAGVYSGSFFRSAIDRALDLWIDAFGFERIEPTPSTASAVFYGDSEATLAQGTLARTDIDTRWQTTADAAIPELESAVWVILVLDVVAGDYTITAGNDYTVPVVGSETLEEIAEAFVDLIAGDPFVELVYPGNDPDGYPVLVLRGVSGEAGVVEIAEGELEAILAVDVDLECTVDGPTVAAAGTINALVATVTGITGVINETDAVLGTLEESNTSIKRRFLNGQGVYEKGTARAVESALLRLAQSYDLAYAEARARENTTDAEVDGVPAHSIAPLVYMPGVPDDEIAAAILAVKANGYQSHGDVVTILLDSHGDAITVGHTLATEAYLHVEIEITVVGELWPSGGDPLTAIAQALAYDELGTGWLLEPGRLRIGADLYRLDLHGPITESVGVGAIKSMTVWLATTAAPEDTPTFADADLVVDGLTVLIPAGSRVSVVGP